MPKTKRDLLIRVAETIGGEQGERIRAALAKSTLFDDLLDRPMSDQDYAAEMKRIESELPSALANKRKVEQENAPTWGWSN